MSTISGEAIFARARTISTQMGGDANSSVVIDSKGGIRALFDSVIREVYRNKAVDQKFIRDIFVRNTVTMASGTGDVPNEIMREFLHLGQFQDANNSLITYNDYNVDQDSPSNFRQIGYVVIQGDEFKYIAPYPTLSTYSGDLYVTSPTFPTFPADMASDITFPSQATIDDVVLALAMAITGQPSPVGV